MYPANNYMSSGTKIVIGTCKVYWGTYRWMFDYEGKIKNVKDPTFCIHMQGKKMLLRTCVDGLRNQIWRYSINKTLFAKNGRKGAVIEDGTASEKALVKHLVYKTDDATDAATWDLHYVGGDLLVMPKYSSFRIVSDLITDNKKWCLIPAHNAINTIGTKLALLSCTNWISFQWMMDNRGRIMNVLDPTKCISRMGMRIQINDCTNDSLTQRWAYSIIDRKLSLLINGQVQATVVNGEAYSNVPVKALPSQVPGPSYQTWEFEEV